MKKLLLLSLLPLLPVALLANSADHKAINKQIAEIKPPRKGVELVDVIRVKSPFILLKRGKNGVKTTYAVKKEVKQPRLMMESSINNRVKINGKWYKEGERVRQYTIIDVSVGEVLLKSKREELKLHLNHANDKIEFKVN
ncbi:MAG: hypothetical protein MUP09_04905 [Thiovulaceae bacterium]|nr:hypothetical protein [Sulfurimonadaceae bacterium]